MTEDFKYRGTTGLCFVTHSLYMLPLRELIAKDGFEYHIYADDTEIQIYFSSIEKSEGAKILI